MTSPCNWSPEKFTQKHWSQGLVPQTVHMKHFEEQVTGTCPKNSNWFEFVGLVAGTKVGQISDGLFFSVSIHKLSPSGKRKVIAVGSLDISDYIMEEPTSHDITVTLKPVRKTVLSGSLEFTLSSVILEDGLPR